MTYNKKSKIISKSIILKHEARILQFSKSWNEDYKHLENFFGKFDIKSSTDKKIINPYFQDWSNIKGYGDILVRPKTKIDCALILRTCYLSNILLTISAGRTNLTGSATPKGGVIMTTELLTEPGIALDIDNREAFCPVGIKLETFRQRVLDLSNNSLYYVADPTSRADACVGGTISTNASGFVPGEKGATRHWVKEIEFLLPNGDLIHIKRGKYISQNGHFKIEYEKKVVDLPVPTYDRPKIKNASGIYSSKDGTIDLIDLIIGSEGILGLIVSCRLGLSVNPKNRLELFISLESESKAIDLYDHLFEYLDKEPSQITALEYFGYNSQNYMDNKEFLFKNDNDVGIYIQIPIFYGTMEIKIDEWINIFKSFDSKLNLDNIIVLNDSNNWQKFFKARHSIPDNALTKTKKTGGVSIITDTIVPKHNFRQYLNKVHKKIRQSGIEYLLFGHLGDCHLHFHLIPDVNQEQLSLEIYDYMIDLSSDLGGVYSAEHGTGKRKRSDFRKCYGDEAVLMVKQLKNKIDENEYLNRGNLISW